MMGVLTAILDRTDVDVIYECRSCGTTVGGQDAACPYCGPTDVVCYDVT